MRRVKLYIAVSLDGKIAKPDGDVNWLHEIPNPDNTDHGYAEFLSGVDTTLMGYSTYNEVLGFGIDFPYPDKTNYVFTRKTDIEDTQFVKFVSGDIEAFVKKIKSEPGQDIWLIGGGQVNTVFFNAKLIDELIIFVMPVVIGDGIPLFADFPKETKLSLRSTKAYSTGAVRMIFNIAK